MGKSRPEGRGARTVAGRGTERSYWFPGVVHLPDAQILQGDDSSGLLVLKEQVRPDSLLPILPLAAPPRTQSGSAPSSPWCTQSSRGSCL